MKRIFEQIISAKDSNTKLAKSLFFGSLIAIAVGYFTSETLYYKMVEGRIVVINKKYYDILPDYQQFELNKKTDYNTIIILVSLLCGATLAYSIIKIKN